MKLELWYPVKPRYINQPFANDPAYYSKFHDTFGNPLKGHNGIDFAAYHGQPVYASHDGAAHYEEDSHGGCGIFIQTNHPYDYNGGEVYFKSIYFHLISKDDPTLHPTIPTDGSVCQVRAGDLIGYADNTGAPYESSGDHLHFGFLPCTLIGSPVEPANGFNGCIDATPYFNGYYAVDVNIVVFDYQKIIDLWKQVLALIKSKLT